MTETDALTRDYRAAFQRYLPRRSEAALTAGYQIGRRSVEEGVSLLDLVRVHHAVLAEILEGPPRQGPDGVLEAASEFLLEVLSTFDMAHRSLADREREPGTQSVPRDPSAETRSDGMRTG